MTDRYINPSNDQVPVLISKIMHLDYAIFGEATYSVVETGVVISVTTGV